MMPCVASRGPPMLMPAARIPAWFCRRIRADVADHWIGAARSFGWPLDSLENFTVAAADDGGAFCSADVQTEKQVSRAGHLFARESNLRCRGTHWRVCQTPPLPTIRRDRERGDVVRVFGPLRGSSAREREKPRTLRRSFRPIGNTRAWGCGDCSDDRSCRRKSLLRRWR